MDFPVNHVGVRHGFQYVSIQTESNLGWYGGTVLTHIYKHHSPIWTLGDFGVVHNHFRWSCIEPAYNSTKCMFWEGLGRWLSSSEWPSFAKQLTYEFLFLITSSPRWPLEEDFHFINSVASMASGQHRNMCAYFPPSMNYVHILSISGNSMTVWIFPTRLVYIYIYKKTIYIYIYMYTYTCSCSLTHPLLINGHLIIITSIVGKTFPISTLRQSRMAGQSRSNSLRIGDFQLLHFIDEGYAAHFPIMVGHRSG